MTTKTTPLPGVPLPAGFVADDWEPGRILQKDEKRSWRLIYRDWTLANHDAGVTVRAFQYNDGSLGDDIEIIVFGASGDDPLTCAKARELAAALLEVADEVDRLEGTGAP